MVRRKKADPYDLPVLACDRCGAESESPLCPRCLIEELGMPSDRRWNGRDFDAEEDGRQDDEEGS